MKKAPILINGHGIYKHGNGFDSVWVVYSLRFKVGVGYKTSKEEAIKFAKGLKGDGIKQK